ncbi:HEAT repeat domain-containing protein [Gemmatimonas sp.]|uniref:HEAT repeat domain-containing protein n=1 Tax=Gemmatimonas sp. TaxID=1962908 RepID=UPI003F72EFAE
MPATLAVARQYSASPTWFVARNAAGLVGEMKSQSAIPDLSRLLKHSDLRVRIAAVVALGHIGGPTVSCSRCRKRVRSTTSSKSSRHSHTSGRPALAKN